MKREIKFRAFTDKGDMIYNFCFLGELNHFQAEDLTNGEHAHSNIVSVMQFTGLHDNNGKPIYEGDIVTYSVEFGEPNETSVGRYDESFTEEVSFIDGSFCVDGFAPVSAFSDKMEVIGNILQNSELLK